MDVDSAENSGDGIGNPTENYSDDDFTADCGEGAWSNASLNETSPNSQQFQQIPSGQVSQPNSNRFTPTKGRQSNGNRSWAPPAQKPQNPSHQQQMSQAPPAQNTMVPPNMNQPPPIELWVETKTTDEKSYFYHAITRETTWNRPDGPNIKIMSQPEFEAYNKQQMKPVEQDPSKMGMMPPAQMPFVPPFNASVPNFGIPPPFAGAWNPPQWQAHGPNVNDSKIDPKILAKASEWTEHRAPDGRPYYYCAANCTSVWERPQALKELDEARMAFMTLQHPPPNMQPHLHQPMISTQGNVMFDSSGNMIKPDALMNKQHVAEMEAEKERKRREMDKKKADEAAAAKQPAKPQDKTRPISSTPIAGTPWAVVWTGDSRVFFYNPSTRTSVWERPEDLVGRADVDKAISTIPEQLRGSDAAVAAVAEKNGQVHDTGKQDNDSEKSMEEDSNNEGEDTEEIPAKKMKTEESPITPIKIQSVPQPVVEKKVDLVKDGAVEAEVRAAKERALVPLEIRVKQFKEMLREKEVSAFSTWEKELHKIVFDPRYLLLASKERKQVFEKYVKDRAEDERREKRNKMQKKRDDFKTLMEEAHLHPRSSFSDFCTRFGRDERYKGIDKMRERETLFNDYLTELRRKEKDEKHLKKEQIRKDFFELLRENSEIDRHARWMDVKKKLDQDARYKAVGDSVLREDYFYEFIKILKDERKKSKSKKSKDKSKDKKDRKEKKTKKESTGDEKEVVPESDTKKSDPVDGVQSKEEIAPVAIEVDEQKSNESEDSDVDQEDGEHSGTDENSDTEKQRKEKERQARAEASIKEREKQVQKTLQENLRDRDIEREHHKKDEAVRHFTALLADLVRSELPWKEVKRQLKKDHRWELVECLDRDDRERIFNDHINSLAKKKRDKFREMLEEISALELTSSWKEIKKQIRDDPRYFKFGTSDKAEREFRDYIRDKTSSAKQAFKELVQECKLITHKSWEMYKENHNHLKDIEEILKNDKRYLILDHISHERTEMLIFFLEELHKRGPPAPITATDSARRK